VVGEAPTEPSFALPADLFAVLGVNRDATHSQIRQVTHPYPAALFGV
jgi:hypothetical protein